MKANKMKKSKYSKPLLIKVLLDNDISLVLNSHDEGDLPPTYESYNNTQKAKVFHS